VQEARAGGRKVETAKYMEFYQSVIPVGAVTRISYLPDQKQRQKKQRKKEEKSFELTLSDKVNEKPMDENQSFQLYC
jgi:predicted 3-demethylubiquinone-9 3-methyltransferase (glyoxalase superfamily)